MDTLDEHTVLENYIDAVLNEAEMDEEWQKASLKGEVKIDEIRYWATQRGSLIQAGGHLFVNFFRETPHSMEGSALLRKVLLKAAGKAFRGEILVPRDGQAIIPRFYREVRRPAS